MKKPSFDWTIIHRLIPTGVRRSYALKLAAIFVLLGITLGTLGLGATYAVTENVQDSSDTQFAESASQQSQQIESWLQNYYNIAGFIAENTASKTSGPGQISQSLRSQTLQFPSILSMHYVNTSDDRIVASTTADLENRSLATTSVPWADDLGFEGQRRVSSPYTSRNVTRLAIIQRVTRDADQAVVLEVESRVATPTLRSDQADLDIGYTEVVTSAGQVVFSEHPSRIGTTYGTGMESQIIDTAMTAGIAGTTLTDENSYIRNELGTNQYLTGYDRVDGTNWVVATHARRDTVYGFAQNLFAAGILGTGVVVVLVGLVGVVVGRNTSADIDQLVDKATEMEQGTLTVDFSTDRIDNVGRLYAEFNRAQQALRGQIKQTKLIEHSYELITVIDPSGTISYQSPSVTHIVGLDAEEIEGEKIFTAIHDADRESVRSAIQHVVENPAQEQQFEFRIQNAAGDWRTFETVCENHLDDPFVEGLVLSSRDVTARKEREEELRDREQAIERARKQLRQTIDLVPDPLYVKNVDDEILLSNKANAELHGMTPEEIEGKRESDIEPAVENIDNFDKYRQREIEVIETGEPTTFEEELTDPNGDTHFFETTRIPFETTRTDENGVLAYARDVTERKAYAEELEELNTRLQLALEETDTGVWSWDLTTDVVQWDETSDRLFGYDDGEFPGTFDGFADRVPDPDLQRVREKVTYAIETDQQYQAEFRVRPPDGKQRWIQARGVVRRDDGGTAEQLLGIQTDITDRKERERELRETKQELETQNERLEEFASVVSHDLRNPLGIAQGRAMMLEEVTADEHEEHIRPLDDALERMEEIITDTLTLARQGQTVGEMHPISLADMVERCWASVETDAATLEIADEMTIQGDSDRLRNVFENLFRNAIEHGGDDVLIRVGSTDNGRLYVEDDGEGIPPDKREQVLEAGHTSASGGTGFGLTIVKRIAEAHGWEVSITDGQDGGARFEFDNVSISEK